MVKPMLRWKAYERAIKGTREDSGVVFEGLDEALEALEERVTGVARGLTVSLWDGVIRRTPQYEGRLVASWTYNLNSPICVDRSHLVPKLPNSGPFRAGDAPAIAVANRFSAGKEQNFTLGDTVYICNGANHGEGPYAGPVETGQVRLRFENLWGHPAVKRTLDLMNARYAGGVPYAAGSQLLRLRIGGNG